MKLILTTSSLYGGGDSRGLIIPLHFGTPEMIIGYRSYMHHMAWKRKLSPIVAPGASTIKEYFCSESDTNPTHYTTDLIMLHFEYSYHKF